MLIRICPAFLLFLASACGLDTRGTWFPWGDADTDAPQDTQEGDIAVEGDLPDFEIPETCGDANLDDGEECDDGNGTDGDGCDVTCRFSCHGDPDCTDGEPCNGMEWCDAAMHRCMGGEILSPGTPCDDGQFCTVASECDGAGLCVGAGYRCDDGLICTRDDCDEEADTCDNGLAADRCLIDGACYNVGDLNPVNECMECRPDVGINAWTLAPDRKSCLDPSTVPGLCCGGVCRPAARCCTDADCLTACTGEATACNLISSTTCSSQLDCAPTSGSGCYGTHLSCASIGLDGDACGHCWNGCSWDSSGCTGTAGSCTAYTSSTDCYHCGCLWGAYSICSGSARPCSSFTDEPSCGGQAGCSWGGGTCGGDFLCH